MEDEWQMATIEEIAEKVGMGPFGSSIKVETFVDDGIPIISGQHLTRTRLIDVENNFISIEHAERLKNANVYRGDVIFTHAGNIGQVAYIPETSKYDRYVISQRQFYMRCNRQKIIPEFVTYFFKSPEGQHKLLANTSSSGVPSIAQPVSYLKTIKVPVPPLPEQRAIAHILGTLDNKIELNRQMNQTLEAMAQALFKSWFVDFEPFREQVMQDSPLGEIPMGWEMGTLSQICEIKMGQSPPGDTYNETGAGISFYQGIKDFGYRFPRPRVYCTMPTRFADPYDVLLSVRAPVGSLNIANERCSIGRGLAALCSKERNHSYLYYLLCNIRNLWDTFNSEGTVFGCITKKDIVDIKIVIPPVAVVKKYESLVSPMDGLIANNEQETRTLSESRDFLLPKLLSGEIRIRDAEKIMEKTA